ncbi:GmrSD restriction endonuclease domain-containing protein [Myroides sp. LJL115]
MSNNTIDKEISFWQLISKNTIQIPAIQRDYVQDRLYSDLQKTGCNIVGDIAVSLKNQTKLNLHFVYGKIEDRDFIPLDGQQRLTTLFLLHWFLSLGTLCKQGRETLSKFTYETRPSSHDFCLKLVTQNLEYNGQQKISEQITNTKWFFLSWENDPTIKAMLRMLDIIQDKFTGPNQDLFNLLCSENCPVTFHFLELEKFKLEDEIYVKMNSRGKPLTSFENFKASFSVLFNLEQRAKLDNEWLDIFWKLERENAQIDLEQVDSKYLKFIENISLCFWAETRDITKEEKDNFVLLHQHQQIYTPYYLDSISKIMDALTTFEDSQNYFQEFLGCGIDYWQYLRFYAVAQFFLNHGELDTMNLQSYNRWIRVCSNLINNTLIQSPEGFYKAIRSIKELAKNSQNIYSYLLEPQTKISGFLQDQVKEEKLKAELIVNDPTNKWQQEIQKIENHSYFNGQISYILNFSKEDNGYNIVQFVDYSNKLNRLFSPEFQDNHSCLFQRALLTYGDYLPKISNYYTFCNFNNSLSAKLSNWRKVFNDTTRSIFLKNLLDKITTGDIKKDLENIISTFPTNITCWRSLFIKNEGVIEYCINFQIEKTKNPQNPEEYGERIFLARSDVENWRSKAELRSYVFYKTTLEEKVTEFSPFKKTFYWDSGNYEPCAAMDNWIYENNHFALDIRYVEGKFSLLFFERSQNDLPSDVVEKLTALGFTKNIDSKNKDTKNENTKSCTCLIDSLDSTLIKNKIQQLISEITKENKTPLALNTTP